MHLPFVFKDKPASSCIISLYPNLLKTINPSNPLAY